MAWIFTPPTVAEVPPHLRRHPLFSRLKLDVGVTVIKQDGFYRQVRGPESADLDTADVIYLGGHEYVVDDAEAAALTDAGYGANLHPSEP